MRNLADMKKTLIFTAVFALFCAPLLPSTFAAEPAVTRVLDGERDLLLAEATSKSLLKSGLIDFALSIDVDVPLEARSSTLANVLAPQAPSPRFALVFQVIQAKTTRRVVDLKPVPSSVFLGYRSQPYAIAADDAVASLPFAQNLAAGTSPLQSYGNGNAPLGPPLMFDYSFDEARIDARRDMSVHAYLIDRKQRTYTKTTFDAQERQRFAVAYRISRYDPKRKTHTANFDSEGDVDAFEKRPFTVKLSALLQAFGANAKTPYADIGELQRTVFHDRNMQLAHVKANTFDARPLNDPRFDSVVAIYTGKRSLGSGFYVTPNVVMSNWHVVGDHKFVELKTYDGQETFGTVLGKDARLDIALIQVQNRGRPVAFYTGRTLDPGLDVEAIGHPRGLEFAITRGIVSAVRKHHSINMPKGAGKEVLYIQTDAPINPGNSGGPLFLGDRVIGMNTWGYRAGTAEGLNFSVHYAELMNFLNAHLPGYAVSPAGDS